jgi:hypothetical protein
MIDRRVGICSGSTSAGRAGSFSTVTVRMGVWVHRPSPLYRTCVERPHHTSWSEGGGKADARGKIQYDDFDMYYVRMY